MAIGQGRQDHQGTFAIVKEVQGCKTGSVLPRCSSVSSVVILAKVGISPRQVWYLLFSVVGIRLSLAIFEVSAPSVVAF
jgi:hypothetical protein